MEPPKAHTQANTKWYSSSFLSGGGAPLTLSFGRMPSRILQIVITCSIQRTPADCLSKTLRAALPVPSHHLFGFGGPENKWQHRLLLRPYVACLVDSRQWHDCLEVAPAVLQAGVHVAAKQGGQLWPVLGSLRTKQPQQQQSEARGKMLPCKHWMRRHPGGLTAAGVRLPQLLWVET